MKNKNLFLNFYLISNLLRDLKKKIKTFSKYLAAHTKLKYFIFSNKILLHIMLYFTVQLFINILKPVGVQF